MELMFPRGGRDSKQNREVIITMPSVMERRKLKGRWEDGKCQELGCYAVVGEVLREGPR